MNPLVFTTHTLIPQGRSDAEQAFHQNSRNEDRLQEKQMAKSTACQKKCRRSGRKLTVVVFDIGESFAGHMNPLLQLVRDMVAQGDKVHYFAEASAKSRVRAAGATFHAYDEVEGGAGSEWNHNDVAVEQCKALGCEPSDMLLQGLPLYHMLLTSLSLLKNGLVERTTALGADLVICDAFIPWGSMVGQLAGIPVVTSCSSKFFSKSERVEMMGFLRDLEYNKKCCDVLQREYGITYDAADTYCNYTPFTICWTGPEFDKAASNNTSGIVHFYGPAFPQELDTATYDEVVGGFPLSTLKARKRDGDTIIYCSMGTLIGNYSFAVDSTPVLWNIINLYGDRPKTTVVISLGKNYDLSKLPKAVPCNVLLVRSVPQKLVLALADVFITHAGNNGVNEALYQGCPMVCIPAVGDQIANGKQVQGMGCGINIKNPDSSGFCREGLQHATRARIEAAVDEALESKQIAAACKHVQAKMKARRGGFHEHGVHDIVKYVTAYEDELGGKRTTSKGWKGM
eukprot:scaffold3941_cov412-Prasinococcus_capsulatus_cf.AAC.11